MIEIAPNARIMGLHACWQLPGGQNLSLAKALHFAIKAQVINLSLSGPSDRLLSKLIDVAKKREETVVAAVDPAASGGRFSASIPASSRLPIGNGFAAKRRLSRARSRHSDDRARRAMVSGRRNFRQPMSAVSSL